MCDWIQWVNARLPHVTGADPDDGVGIDCLVMCLKLRASAGLSVPRLNPEWFTLAERGEWAPLMAEWEAVMERCEIEPYGMLLQHHPNGLIGVSIVIDGGVLTVHHRRGVQWLPMDVASRLMDLQCWRPKHAPC